MSRRLAALSFLLAAGLGVPTTARSQADQVLTIGAGVAEGAAGLAISLARLDAALSSNAASVQGLEASLGIARDAFFASYPDASAGLAQAFDSLLVEKDLHYIVLRIWQQMGPEFSDALAGGAPRIEPIWPPAAEAFAVYADQAIDVARSHLGDRAAALEAMAKFHLESSAYSDYIGLRNQAEFRRAGVGLTVDERLASWLEDDVGAVDPLLESMKGGAGRDCRAPPEPGAIVISPEEREEIVRICEAAEGSPQAEIINSVVPRAAEGDPEAMLILAGLYQAYGRDSFKAFRWLSLAAEAGSPVAQQLLAQNRAQMLDRARRAFGLTPS